MAAVELELFTKLSGGKQMKLNELQKALGMEVRPTAVFASALSSLGLLQITKTGVGSESLFANSPISEMFLDKSKDSYMGDIISMFDKCLYKAWDKLIESLQTNKPVSAADGGGAETLFDRQNQNRHSKRLRNLHMQCMVKHWSGYPAAKGI